MKTNILPRQARDKHRVNSKKESGFPQDHQVQRHRWGVGGGDNWIAMPALTFRSQFRCACLSWACLGKSSFLTPENSETSAPFFICHAAFRRYCRRALLRYVLLPVSKNGLFEPFIYKNDLFAKTGSGQTWEKLQKSMFSQGGARALPALHATSGRLGETTAIFVHFFD